MAKYFENFCNKYIQSYQSLKKRGQSGKAESLSEMESEPGTSADQIFLQKFFKKFLSTFSILVFFGVASSRRQESANSFEKS